MGGCRKEKWRGVQGDMECLKKENDRGECDPGVRKDDMEERY